MPFRDEWFAPHYEFRFPLLGQITRDGVHLELRQAIEPWHVLGEETTQAGTARYVDSSLERVQVKVSGLIDPRYAVTCNGRLVPLHPTGVDGEYVAGVRYRAWQPPSCLHPTIAVHAPLVFDVYDRWMQRSLGGCTYHVAHPGGRSYDTFPVNANEAEGRRISRFSPLGHTTGAMPLPLGEVYPEAPLTLDLRQPAPMVGNVVERKPPERGTRPVGLNGSQTGRVQRPVLAVAPDRNVCLSRLVCQPLAARIRSRRKATIRRSAMMKIQRTRRCTDCPRRDIPA